MTLSEFDPDLALQRCFGSPEILRDMMESFHSEVELLFPQMRLAIQKGDLAEVGRLGHRLKGTVVYLGADAAKEAVLRVEYFENHPGDNAEAEEAVQRLQQQCEVLKSALAAFLPRLR